MTRLHSIELHLLMLAGIAFLCVSGWQVWRAGKTLDAVNGAIAGVNGTITNLNRPCKGEAGPDACGMLAQVNESVIRIDDAVTTMQIQVKQTGKLTDAAAKSISRASDDLHETTIALTGTANAATGMLKQGRTDLATMNDSIAATKPLIEASTATVKHYDAMAPTIAATAGNVQHMTFHINAIAGDAQKISDKETRDFLKPVKWYMRPVKRFGEIWDITAAVARHTP